MKYKRMINTVDVHTCGMPVRMVTGGIPHIPGKTMQEKRNFMIKNLDHLRTSLVHEPRGHSNMFACVLTPPTNNEAHFGLLFMTPDRYSNMCGHGTMGASVIAIEMGIVEIKEPVTEIIIDTPAGLVRTKVMVEDDKARSVTLQNVPSFQYKTQVIRTESFGDIPVDIAYGGLFYAIVEAKHLGLTTQDVDPNKIIDTCIEIKEAVNEQVKVQHPKLDYMNKVDLVEICDNPTNKEADVRNIASGDYGRLDRSPCGTGTSAKMASLYAKGKLGLGETFVTESILGTLFLGKLTREVKVAGFKAVLPEVMGSAFVTGFHQFVIDEDDPLKYGFKL
jgi:proline racemase